MIAAATRSSLLPSAAAWKTRCFPNHYIMQTCVWQVLIPLNFHLFQIFLCIEIGMKMM